MTFMNLTNTGLSPEGIYQKQMQINQLIDGGQLALASERLDELANTLVRMYNAEPSSYLAGLISWAGGMEEVISNLNRSKELEFETRNKKALDALAAASIVSERLDKLTKKKPFHISGVVTPLLGVGLTVMIVQLFMLKDPCTAQTPIVPLWPWFEGLMKLIAGFISNHDRIFFHSSHCTGILGHSFLYAIVFLAASGIVLMTTLKATVLITRAVRRRILRHRRDRLLAKAKAL